MTGPQAYVWALAHPDAVKQAEAAIAQALRVVLRATDAARQVIEVSPSSGWISYVDRGLLWSRQLAGRVPERATDARTRAEEFLRAVAHELDEPAVRRRAPSLDGIALMPRLMPLETVIVPRTDSEGWDHWLHRAQPMLPLDDRRVAPIVGAQIEVRVGDGGQIASYRARYRPTTSERITTAISPPVDTEHAPPIVYVQGGDGIPQHYLAPYYRVVEDGEDVPTLASASPWSLTIALDVVATERGARVTAVVDGGSGDYAFDWGAYPIDGMASGHFGLGAGSAARVRDRDGRSIQISSVTLDAGAYIVMVNVKDRRTGAFKHHQQQVYAHPSVRGTLRPPMVSW